MNNIAYFEIQSSNPAREISFYQYVFAWTFTEVKGLPIQYYQIETQGIHGGLLEPPAATPPTHCGTNAFTCSFEVEDFDQPAALILRHGGQVVHGKICCTGPLLARLFFRCRSHYIWHC